MSENHLLYIGLPEVIVTDNGPSFVSEEFETFLRNNGIQHKKTPPYHPSSNGLAERAVQIFKRGMKKMKKGSLQDKISRFLFSYRNTPQGTTGSTPAQLLMGRTPRSPETRSLTKSQQRTGATEVLLRPAFS